VSLGDERRDEAWKCLYDPALDEEGALDASLVEYGKDPVDVANHALGDRGVIVEAGLVPIFDVDRESV
jgi:hypothetical protein